MIAKFFFKNTGTYQTTSFYTFAIIFKVAW